MSDTTGPSDRPDLRAILDDVAAGRLSADQASRLLGQTVPSADRDATTADTGAAAPTGAGSGGAETSARRTGDGSAPSAPTHDEPSEPGPTPRNAPAGEHGSAAERVPGDGDDSKTGRARTLRVRAVGRRVRIVGEPFLSAVAVEGPHVMKTDGDVLTVASEGEFTPSLDNFTLRTPSLRDLQERFVDLTRELVIRANPRLDLEIEVTAGSVSTERVPDIRHLRITAGSAKLRDVTGPLDLLVQGGSATVEGPLSKGESKLRVESGSLNLNLLHGSDVTVTQDVQLGRITWDGESSGADQHVVGNGSAAVRVEALMANISVREA